MNDPNNDCLNNEQISSDNLNDDQKSYLSYSMYVDAEQMKKITEQRKTHKSNNNLKKDTSTFDDVIDNLIIDELFDESDNTSFINIENKKNSSHRLLDTSTDSPLIGSLPFGMGTTPPKFDLTNNNHIETRRIHKWVEDNSIDKCYGCQYEFTFMIRKHHCRLCGRIFCYKCCNYHTVLPIDIITKIPERPKNVTDYIINRNDDFSQPVKVCGSCFTHSNKLNRIKKIIKVFELCQFNIRDLIFMKKISQDYEYASNFILSKFREIQYKISMDNLSQYEKRMLWINRQFLSGHFPWMVQLVKSTNLNNDEHVISLTNLLYKQPKNTCWDMMCSRVCSSCTDDSNILPTITSHTTLNYILDLIKYNSNHPIISNFILKYFEPLDFNLLIDYLPFITFNLENNEYMLDNLMTKCWFDFKYLAHLYWCIKIYCGQNNRIKYLNRLLDEVKKQSDELQKKFDSMIAMNTIDITNLFMLNKKNEPIVLPICHDKTFVSVDDKNVRKIQSYSQPIIIDFIDSNNIKKQIMYKKDDVRKDHIILNIINIIHTILQKEEPDLVIDIIKYEVMPTSNGTGYIEIVENASTIFNIIERMGMSIQNFILNNNKNQLVSEFRNKFIKSTALYCVVSYLLGIGDRHLENIMISKSGLLFHIDFGFILGQDPKYTSNKIIRVTPEIINVIGGHGSEDYEIFKKTCVKIYNRLRLHVNLFANLLSIMPSIDPSLTNDIIKNELIDRFEIGENHIEAATHMDNKVNSHYNFEYMVIDFLHKVKQTYSLKSLTHIASYVSNFAGGLTKIFK